MFILLTGPEKAGKTTLAAKLLAAECRLHVVHARMRRPGEVDGREYLHLVKLGACSRALVVVDRGWPDEFVYTRLLGRRSLMPSAAWNEWCLGEPARQVGVTALVLPTERLAPLDDSDFQLSWEVESTAFREYALRNRYLVVDPRDPGAVDLVLSRARERELDPVAQLLPAYCGSPLPQVVLVGEARNERSRYPLAWAPMTTPTFAPLAEALAGLQVGRTNAADLQLSLVAQLVRDAPVVVALGRTAREAVRWVGRDAVVTAPHPAAVTRWGRYSRVRESYADAVRRQVDDALSSLVRRKEGKQ